MPENNLPARTTGELMKTSDRFPILNPEFNRELKANLEANVGPRGLSDMDLETLKVPTGGGLSWTVPTIEGEENAKELTGIILAWRDTRRYWRIPYAERGKKKGPPDCSSKDGFWGTGDPGGDCGQCPLAEFGSDVKGRGQACREVRQLLFLRDGCNLPDVVNIPATSLKPLKSFMTRLANQNVPFWSVITTLRLERTQNADGVEYAKVHASASTRLNAEERAILHPFQQQMEGILKPSLVLDADSEEVAE